MNFLRDNKREFIILTIYILFVPFPLGMIPLLFLSELAQTNWVESDFLNFAVGITVSALTALILFRKELRESFGYFKEHSLWKILSLPLWMAAIPLVESLAQGIYGKGLNPENQAALSEMSKQIPLFFTILILGVLGPIIEEIIFRHIFLNRLSNYTGTLNCSPCFYWFIHRYAYAATYGFCPLCTWSNAFSFSLFKLSSFLNFCYLSSYVE